MDREHVGPAEQLGLGDMSRAGLFGGFAGQVRAPGYDLHAEGRPDSRHPGADPAQAQHAEHRSAELAPDRRLPTAGAHRQMFVDDPPGRSQNERPGQLDRRLDIASGRADIDSVLLGSGEVDRGVERSGGRNHLEVGQTINNVARQRCSLPHDADHVVRQQPVDHGVGIGEVVVEDRDVGSGSDRRPVGHTHRDVLVIVENRNLHRAQSFTQVMARGRSAEEP